MAGRRRDGDRIPADRERNSRRRRVMVVVVTEVMSFDRIGVMRDGLVVYVGIVFIFCLLSAFASSFNLCFLLEFCIFRF